MPYIFGNYIRLAPTYRDRLRGARAKGREENKKKMKRRKDEEARENGDGRDRKGDDRDEQHSPSSLSVTVESPRNRLFPALRLPRRPPRRRLRFSSSASFLRLLTGFRTCPLAPP